jgi:non-specific serine/threonine protein kinase
VAWSGDGGDWRERLFRLGAAPAEAGFGPAARFWHELSRAFLLHFQRAAADFWSIDELEGRAVNPAPFRLPPPPEDLLPGFLAVAPPLVGGEYLEENLPSVWGALGRWLEEALAAAGGPAPFLAEYAPQWQKVGRVYFHLAENKADPDYPFLFVATYTTGLAPGGRPQHKPLGRALNDYIKAGDKPVLKRLLTPVDRAAQSLAWVGQLESSKRIFNQHTPFNPAEAYRFLKDIPQLEAAGLWARVPDWWQKRPPRAGLKIVLDAEERQARLSAASLLSFDRRLVLGDEELTEDELKKLLAGQDGLVFFKGRWVEVDKERLNSALEQWKAIEGRVRQGEISFSQGMRLLAGLPGDWRSAEEPDEEGLLRFEAGPQLAGLLAAMREAPPAGDHPALATLRGQLRPYQQKGADWLIFMTSLGLGACLADDMGLGKTIQVLTLLSHLKYAGPGAARPSLLVLPASLLGNWRAEARKFAPGLNLRFIHRAVEGGRDLELMAKNQAKTLAGCDLVVTTYAMLTRQPWLQEVEWNLVAADEAQAVKNPGARQTKALKSLKAGARLALTGTPVENRLSDLWSLFDFLNPGLLGSAGDFAKYAARLAKSANGPSYAPLKRLTSPYILRRLKTDRKVISDLPDKVESVSFCQLSKKQAALYEKIVDDLAVALESGAGGMARRGLILQTLMRLKQICNHPDQLNGAGGYDLKDSGKFKRLAEICGEMAERQERVLIFTQFREIIAPLAALLSHTFGRPGLTLHGGTRATERHQLVEDFQREDGPPFFILSLKAGGTGLNLTAAARVVHFDRWWNPAVENQATDRAFRIGQTRNVMVHKLVCAGTVEEKIHEIILEKSRLADQILGGSGQVDLTSLSDAAIMDMVRMDLSQVSD